MTLCYFCSIQTTATSRLHCPKCKLTFCGLCAFNHLGKKIQIKRPFENITETSSSSSQPNDLIQLMNKKDEDWKSMVQQLAEEKMERKFREEMMKIEWEKERKEFHKDMEYVTKVHDSERQNYKQELKRLAEDFDNEKWKHQHEVNMLQSNMEKERDKYEQEIRRLKQEMQNLVNPGYSQDEYPSLPKQQVNVLLETEVVKSSVTTEEVKKKRVTNQLYNVELEFDIPGIKLFTLKSIIDTGATSCCVNKSKITMEALEPLGRSVSFSGLNGSEWATHRVKAGNFLIGGNKFRIPLIYALNMKSNDGIDMLIGANFLRSMNGGVRIEGDEITFYKKVTKIKTQPTTEIEIPAIRELSMNEEEYIQIQEYIFFSREDERRLHSDFKPILETLKKQGYIGDDPLKHWKQNGELCKLDIINPDITIQDKPLKHVTPAMEESFKKHVNALLEIGVIRPSKSRHRTMAMIVNSGVTIDPKTGKEIRGKERMVFNYKTLNDNTYKDQYTLPGINTLIQRIGNANIYSKFDLKSGFHLLESSSSAVSKCVIYS